MSTLSDLARTSATQIRELLARAEKLREEMREDPSDIQMVDGVDS